MRSLAVAFALALVLGACRKTDFVTDKYWEDGGAGSGGAAGSAGRGGAGGTRTGGSGSPAGTGGSTSGAGGVGGAAGAGGSAGTGGTVSPRDAAGTGGSAAGGSGGQPVDMAAPPDLAIDTPPVGMDMAGARIALLVTGPPPLIATDTLVRNRLAAKLMVEVVPETMATAESAQGKALVVITSTTSAMGTNTKFRDVSVPVILLEPNLMGPMRLTADVATERGTLMETRVTIVAAGDPLAAGLNGNVAVYTTPGRLVWGLPAPAATRVAHVTGMANRPAIFAYGAGAAMMGGMAPAKRVGFFLHENPMIDPTTPDGVKLLDAAIDWCLSP